MNPTIRRILTAIALFLLGAAVVRLSSPAQVAITWETASEVDAAGFRLYRSETAAGPFTLLPTQLIPAQGDPLVGAAYSYDDKDVRWGQVYFYQLEEVTLNGATSRYPDIVHSRAGLGWMWAAVAGILLALVGVLSEWLPARKETPAAETPAAEMPEEETPAAELPEKIV